MRAQGHMAAVIGVGMIGNNGHSAPADDILVMMMRLGRNEDREEVDGGKDRRAHAVSGPFHRAMPISIEEAFPGA